MKTIGLIGGLTWLSTVEYYKQLNQLVNQQIGGVASAKILLYSVNFEEIKTLTIADDWDGLAVSMIDIAKNLEQAGADCLLLGANTMHKIADVIQQSIAIPLIHIAEATATEIAIRGLKTVALLGTRYTMQMNFYTNKLRAQGIEALIPGEADIEFVNNAIYNEMSRDLFLPETKTRVHAMIDQLGALGAEGVILGCTELPILLKGENCPLPLFDTTQIHARAAVDFALKEGK